MATYTPQQKAKIAGYFLSHSPHGEAHEIIKSLKAIVKPSNIISDKWQNEYMSELNKNRFELINHKNSTIICCPQSEIKPNQYLQPDAKVICTIDPIKQKVINESKAPKLPNEDYRSAISGKLREYLDAYYEDGSFPNSIAKGCGAVYVVNKSKIAVVISWRNYNPQNYWTGGWQSEWTLDISKKSTQKLEGRIRLNVHYYEAGNVQLNSTFTEQSEVKVTDPNQTASELVAEIMKLETIFQKRFDQFYVQMHDETFKSMRRFLPRIRTRLDWGVKIHALISEANSK